MLEINLFTTGTFKGLKDSWSENGSGIYSMLKFTNFRMLRPGF